MTPKIRYILSRLRYRWAYLKVAFILCGSAWPKHAKCVVMPGSPGWWAAWLVFALVYPKGWVALSAKSCTEIRKWISAPHKMKSDFYGHPNQCANHITGYQAAIAMITKTRIA